MSFGMFPLRCSVRNCENPLHSRDRSLACDAGHSFDQAKFGYWNLTQPQDKKSTNPGDSDEAVLARNRWLEQGFMSEFVEVLRPWTELVTSTTETILDLGCGEGTFGEALFESQAEQFCGIDLSRKALRIAQRRFPKATWVLANADRTLPVADGAVFGVLSLFGRRPAKEIVRVLASDGICIVAIPAEDDFIELRKLVQGSGERRSRWEAATDELTKAGLELVEHKTWRKHVKLDPHAIEDALAMTYRGARNSEKQRLAENTDAMEVTLAADLMLFRRSSG